MFSHVWQASVIRVRLSGAERAAFANAPNDAQSVSTRLQLNNSRQTDWDTVLFAATLYVHLQIQNNWFRNTHRTVAKRFL